MPSERNDDPGMRVCLRLLGAPELVVDGARVDAFDALRIQRFFGLLAIRGAPQHRARIAYELWPDSTETQARTNLRKLLHELRQCVPRFRDLVDAEAESAVLVTCNTVDIDVWRFNEAVANGDLELAARLYTGELLPACYDDWVIDERRRLGTEAHRVLLQLAESSFGRGDHQSTVQHCHRLLGHEPTDETAFCLLMRCHVALGDRTAALRAYHRCVETLDRELGVEPGDKVAAIYRSLRVEAAPADSPEPSDSISLVGSPFVGRTHELDALRRAWDRAQTGRAHLVLVSGEPGIGKTRLAAELARFARSRGNIVASARAFEAAGRLPWAPVIDLLRSDELRTDVEQLEPLWRAELGRLLPELLDERPKEASAVQGDLSHRYRLFDAVGRAFAGRPPRLLVLDDLQWCDTDTLEMIGFVIRAHPEASLLVVGTVRPEELGEDHPLDDVLAALRRDASMTTVALEPLDESDTLALAEQMAGSGEVSPETAQRIWEETEGNPLFVIESLRATLDGSPGRGMLTPTIRSVLLRRLNQLPEGPQRLAEVAAVIGRPFTVPFLQAVTRLGEDEIVDDVDELWRRRIISDHRQTYDFSHDKLRAVSLERVSPARRRQLHRAVATALEAGSGSFDAGAAQLAAHYDQAGMIEPAVHAYRQAGAQAVAVSSLVEAVTMLQRALAVLADLPPSSDRDELELDLRIALGSPLVALEGYGSGEAHQVYERARVLSRKLDQPVAPPVLRGLGLARLQGCRFDDAAEMGKALVHHAKADPVARTEGHYLLGVSAFWSGDLAGARRSLEDALAGYDPSHRDEHLALYAQDPRAVCLVRLAWVELWSGDSGAADATARSALTLARELEHLMTTAYVTTYAAVIAAESRDLPRLGELLDDLDAVWSQLPLPYLMILGDALRGWFEVCDGVIEGTERILRAVSASRAEGETLHLTYCLLLLARARGLVGQVASGRAATTEALTLTNAADQHYLEAELWRVDGELAHRAGGHGTAADSLSSAVSVAASQGASWLQMQALSSQLDHFPDQDTSDRLEVLVDTLPSGHELPAFRIACRLLGRSG